MAQQPAILVAGAYGAFGRALVVDLLRYSECRVLAAGRSRADISTFRSFLNKDQQERLAPAICNLSDLRSVASALTNAQAAVCAAGPYQNLPAHLLDACRHRGIPYLDLADDRGFARRARAMAADDGPSPSAPAKGCSLTSRTTSSSRRFSARAKSSSAPEPSGAG